MKLPWTASEKLSEKEPVSNSTNQQPNNIKTENIKVNIPDDIREEQEMITNYTPGQKILLRDTSPKYSEEEQLSGSSYEKVLQTFSKDDLKPANLVGVPCFRQAGLLGLSTMFVVGSVMFLSLKNVKRATNWAVAGFSVGSIFGWEKCRYQRRKELEVANKLDAVQNSVKERQLEKLEKQKAQALTEAEKNKKWYKPW